MAGDIIGQAYIEITPLTSRFQQQLDQTLQRVQSSGGFKVPIAGETSALENSIRKAAPKQGYMMAVSGNTKPLEDAVTRTLMGFTQKALGIAGIFSIGAMIISHLKDAVYGFNNTIQQAQIGLETLLGSAQMAADLIENLKVFARTTPFQFADLVKSAQTLVAMGTAAKDVIPTLDAVGNALSGLGRMSSMPRVLFDLGQIRATGRLTGRELMNMAMQGIPVLKYLADATGRSIQDLREAMAKGTRSAQGMLIESTVAIHAILTGMENQFGGLMQRQMNTAAGAISNFKDAEQQLLGAIGMPLFNKIVESTLGISNALNNMSTAFSEAGKQGKSGLTAVREVFVDLFPEAARSTIRSILDNLSKMIGDLGAIIKTVTETSKEWGSYIIGGLLVGLRGVLDVIRPLTDFLARHKIIVEDLVKAYIALKVVAVIQSLWVKMNLILDQQIAKTVQFVTATKASTSAVMQNTSALLAQRAAMGVGMTGISTATAAESGAVSAARISAINTALPGIGAAEAGVMSTRLNALRDAAQNSAARLQMLKGAAIGAVVGLEVLKTQLNSTDQAAQGLTTAAQGAALGFAVAGPWGAAIGGIGGLLMGVKSAFDAAANAAKKFNAEISGEASDMVAKYIAKLDDVFGTDTSSIPGKISALYTDATALLDRGNKEIADGLAANDKRLLQAGKTDQEAYQKLLAQVQPGGALFDYVDKRRNILAAASADTLTKIGIDTTGLLYSSSDRLAEAGIKDRVKSTKDLVNELADGTISQAQFDAETKILNDLNITTISDMERLAKNLDKVGQAYADADKEAKAFIKSQTDGFQLDLDQAGALKALASTYDSVAKAALSLKPTMADITSGSEGLLKALTDAGTAAYNQIKVAGGSMEEAQLAARTAEQGVVEGFVGILKTAGMTQDQINGILKSLGMLDLYKEITLKLNLDTTGFWAEFQAVTHIMDRQSLVNAQFMSPEVQAAVEADIARKNAAANALVRGAPSIPKAAGGGNAAATALEGASKAFYDTIVQSAKDFHTSITSIMGSPAERLQQTQAVGVGSLIRNTSLRTAAITDWTQGLAKLRSEGLSQIAIDALKLQQGPEMDRQVKRLLQSSPADIARLNAALTAEQDAAQKAAYAEQGGTIAKAITDALAKFFADAGKKGTGNTIEITNQITQAQIDPQALALAIVTSLGGKVKL